MKRRRNAVESLFSEKHPELLRQFSFSPAALCIPLSSAWGLSPGPASIEHIGTWNTPPIKASPFLKRMTARAPYTFGQPRTHTIFNSPIEALSSDTADRAQNVCLREPTLAHRNHPTIKSLSILDARTGIRYRTCKMDVRHRTSNKPTFPGCHSLRQLNQGPCARSGGLVSVASVRLGLNAGVSPDLRAAVCRAALIVAHLKGWWVGLDCGEIPTAADEQSACGGVEGAAIVTGG